MGAAGLAALLKDPGCFKGKKAGLLLCGGNIDLLLLLLLLLTLTLTASIACGSVRAGRLARIIVSVRGMPGSRARITATVAKAGANLDEVHHHRRCLARLAANSWGMLAARGPGISSKASPAPIEPGVCTRR